MLITAKPVADAHTLLVVANPTRDHVRKASPNINWINVTSPCIPTSRRTLNVFFPTHSSRVFFHIVSTRCHPSNFSRYYIPMLITSVSSRKRVHHITFERAQLLEVARCISVFPFQFCQLLVPPALQPPGYHHTGG
jgi:hypothetical protein